MQSHLQAAAQMMSLNSDALSSGKHFHEMGAFSNDQNGSALNSMDSLNLLADEKRQILAQSGNLGSNGNNNGANPHQAAKHQVPFNGLSFHNPFDVNSYPLTNPPLYDPTMLPLGAPGNTRRRRISISNGQIGQIVNHEAFYLDDDSLDDYYDSGQPLYRPMTNQGGHDQHQNHSQQHLSNENMRVHHNQDHQLLGLAGTGLPVSGGLNGDRPDMGSGMSSAGVSAHSSKGGPGAVGVNAGTGVNTSSSLSSGLASPSVAGVPPQNQTLVYNNEVIYNPHDGPIPGTAAWKKERLLERNRVAASKCRQRKKHAQEQLQTNMARFEREIREKDQKLEKAEKLLAMYRSALQQHFDGNATALDAVRPFVKHPLSSIKFEPNN